MSVYPTVWRWAEGLEGDEFFLDVAARRAARKALGIVNRLPPGPTKKRHASRVWKNYNQLRRAAA